MGRGGEGEGSCDHQLLHDHLIMSEDVLIQILLCLPVISLLRFKSVCKSWRSIIESSFFIHLHATTKSGGGSSSFLFFRYTFHRGDEEEEEEKKKGNVFTLSGDKFEVFEDLGRPSVEDWTERKTFYDGIAMVGCCNGIVCLREGFSRCVALWNPAIKQSRILPKPSNLLGNRENLEYSVIDSVGFGIDVKTQDYKVLLITSIKPLDFTSIDDELNMNEGDDKTKSPFARSVQVYSLSTNSWKCTDANLSAAHPDLDINMTSSWSYMHLNGRCFFMAQYYIKVEDITYNSGLQAMPLILSFDFTQEIFTTIDLPYDRRNKFDTHSYAGLLLFGEKIALIDSSGPYDELDIWVLNEQQGSWTKFYTFGPYKIPYLPHCIVDNGEFAIMHGYDQDPCQDDLNDQMKLHLFNFSTGETNDLQCDCEGLRRVDIYKPSLVPIGGNGATDDDKPICGV